jgi:hypothetical protein
MDEWCTKKHVTTLLLLQNHCLSGT